MTGLEAVTALATATTAAIELMSAINKAALIINQRQQRGGDYTPEEIAAIDDMVRLSEINRTAAISKAKEEGR